MVAQMRERPYASTVLLTCGTLDAAMLGFGMCIYVHRWIYIPNVAKGLQLLGHHTFGET